MSRIGVIGAYGAVGSAVVQTLHAAGVQLRLGGRDASKAAALAASLGSHVESAAVDVFDAQALARFCDGLDLVVHAGAPSHLSVDTVANAALAQGADYVDAGGDIPLFDALDHEAIAQAGRRVLVTAGMMPGLTGMLPRMLAKDMTTVLRLQAHVAVMDRLTPAGAVDYLLSLGDREEESQALWLGGRRVAGAAKPSVDVQLPFFDRPVSTFPYLSYEAQRLAVQLDIPEVRWFSVFDGGGHMMDTLSRLQGAMSGQGDLHAAAAELSRAAEIDMFGRQPYQLILIELTGLGADGVEATRTIVVRSDDTSRLTGTVCGLCALEVLDGRVPAGVHFAAEGVEPARLLEKLQTTDAVRRVEVHCVAAAEAGRTVEEGVL